MNNEKTFVYCAKSDCAYWVKAGTTGQCNCSDIIITTDAHCDTYVVPTRICLPKPARAQKKKHAQGEKRPTTQMVENFKPKDVEGHDFKLYEGFRGDMVINKVFAEGEMYALVDPIVQKGVSVYAAWNNEEGRFYGFATDCTVGWHFPGGEVDDFTEDGDDFPTVNWICTGELKYHPTMTKAKARDMCKEVAKQLELINWDNADDEISGDYDSLTGIINQLEDYPPDEIYGFSDYLRPLL